MSGSAVQDRIWGGIGLAILLGGWAWGAAVWGPFVLPSLTDTLAALARILITGDALAALGSTLLHAVGGAGLGAVCGLSLGVAGGLWRPFGSLLTPSVTAILGVPPVAWVVLTLLWFGPGLISPLFTVTLATMPILFAASLQGMRARDPHLIEMAGVFRVPAVVRMTRIILPELAVHIAPALSTLFALSWKVALTAELLGDGSGIGGRFATARAHLDLPEAMAWIVLVIIFLLITDGLLLGPLRHWIAGHRGAQAMTQRPGPACVGIGGLRKEA